MILGMVILFITNDLFPIFSIRLDHLLCLKIFASVLNKYTYVKSMDWILYDRDLRHERVK